MRLDSVRLYELPKNCRRCPNLKPLDVTSDNPMCVCTKHQNDYLNKHTDDCTVYEDNKYYYKHRSEILVSMFLKLGCGHWERTELLDNMYIRQDFAGVYVLLGIFDEPQADPAGYCRIVGKWVDVRKLSEEDIEKYIKCYFTSLDELKMDYSHYSPDAINGLLAECVFTDSSPLNVDYESHSMQRCVAEEILAEFIR